MRAMDAAIATSERDPMRLRVDKAVHERRIRSHCANTKRAIDTTCSDYRQNFDSMSMVITQLQICPVYEPPSSFQMEAEQGPCFLLALDGVARSPPFYRGLRPHCRA